MSETLEVYPLRAGVTLAGNEWVELRFHRLLKSSWRAAMTAGTGPVVSPEAGFFGQMLWWESLVQDPAGTLPDDDVELAQLAGLGVDLERWRRVRGAGPREGALYGWRPCIVEREGEEPARRLWHHTVLLVVQETLRRTQGRQEAGAEGARRMQLSRIRKLLGGTGLSRRAIEDGATAEVVRVWLAARKLVANRENVQRAIEEVSKGNVVQMPDPKGK